MLDLIVSVPDHCLSFYFPTLHINRLRCIATETYKSINNLSPEYLRYLVEMKQSNYSFRYGNTVKIPTESTVTYGQRSFIRACRCVEQPTQMK